MKTQEAMCLNLVKQNLPGHRQSRTVAVESFVPSGTFSQFFPSLMGTFWLTQSVTWMINEDDWGEGGGGWMEPHSRVFDMLQYFETILPSVESLWSS